MKRRELSLWIVGPLLLIALNLRRDASRAAAHYNWEATEKGTLHRGVNTPGVMEAARVFEIKSEVDETVEKKMVQEGQSVKEGQALMRLSRTRTQLEYEQKRNANLSAESDFKKATRELAVQKKLLKSMAVSRSQVEDAEQNVERTQAAYEIAAQELEIMKKKLDSTVVRAPLGGVVLKDYTQVGSAVSVGKEIITVGDVSQFIVRAKVDELDIQQVTVGQMVEIVADAFQDQPMKGKVRSIATQAEREAFAKIEVLIDVIPVRDVPLKHNYTVRVNIITEDIPDALSIPIKSVFKKDTSGHAWVLMRGKWGLARNKKIMLGKTAGDRVQVVSGLKEGDLVGIERPADANP